MSDAFDSSPIYELLGQPVKHFPLSGGEVSGFAVLNVPGKEIFGGDAISTDPSIRFSKGSFSVQRGDSFLVGDDVWRIIAPPMQLNDGSEVLVQVVRVTQ